MNSKKWVRSLWGLSLIVTFGCGKTVERRHAAASAPEVEAPDLVSEAFVLDRRSSTRGEEQLLGIRKDALDKEFLLQGSLMAQQKVPQFQGLKSRIIAFKLRDQKLYAMEATQGHTVTRDLPQNLVLTSFPIIRETENEIYFDFNAGMRHVALQADWYAEEKEKEYEDTYDYSNIDTSYLEDVAIIDNALVIRQVSQMLSKAPKEKEEGEEEAKEAKEKDVKVHVETKYYLTPYRPNPDFEPTRSPGFRHVGFFEVSPQWLEGGKQLSLASKFDARKPIVYAVSANTPADYRQAVKDGVLYWNKAFGREVLQVVDAPEGVVAPDYKHNVVQWVNWDDAGYAYADAQMDPRTGEILHAQIFMTSAFAFSGKKHARRLLALLDDKPETAFKVGIRGFDSHAMCARDLNGQLKTALTTLVAKGMDDPLILKMSQDYVREVVAHEVGHTLGLRHNFAGSLGANFGLEEREDIVSKYLHEGHAPLDKISSSTIMEYQNYEESILSGDQIAHAPKAFPYDEKVIGVLYGNQKIDPKDMPLFCTDHQAKDHLDCRTFDAGSNPLAYQLQDPTLMLQATPNLIAFRYLKAKENAQRMTDITKATISPDELAKLVYEGRAVVLEYFRADRKLVQVRAGFEYLNDLNESDAKLKEIEHTKALLDAIGGVEKLLAPVTTEQLKGSEELALKTIRDLGTFEDAEITLLESEIKKLYAELPSSLEVMHLKLLATLENPLPLLYGEELFAYIGKEANRLLLTVKPEKQNGDVSLFETTTFKNLPKYEYPFSLRKLAVALLAPKEGQSDWGFLQRQKLKAALEKHIEEVTTQPIEEVALEQLADADAKWFAENLMIWQALSQ